LEKTQVLPSPKAVKHTALRRLLYALAFGARVFLDPDDLVIAEEMMAGDDVAGPAAGAGGVS
jgi:hypothetical protein